MLTVNIEHVSNVGVLTFSGEMISRHAGEFAAALMKAICSYENVFVKFETISKIDATVVQLLCTAARKAKFLKKQLIFDSEWLRSKIAQSCRRRHSACAHDTCALFGSETCLLRSLCDRGDAGQNAMDERPHRTMRINGDKGR